MQKPYYLIFIVLAFCPSLFPLNAMNKINSQEKTLFLPDNLNVNTILNVHDSTKFAFLVQEIANKPYCADFKINTERGVVKGLNYNKKVELLKQSITELELLHLGISAEHKKLSQQIKNPWNRERLKGLGKTLLWTIGTGGLLTIQSYIYLSDFNPNAKIIAGVPLMAGVIGSFIQCFGHANKTLDNSHINEKIENYLEKISFIQTTKQTLENNIELLEKEKKAFPSSELDEIPLH